MSTPQRYRRKAWRRGKSFQQTGLSRRDTIRLLLIVMILGIATILIIHFVTDLKVGRDRTEALEAMQSKYALSEAQVAAIRYIEDRYHGKGGIFTIPGHKFEEDATHSLAISQHMNPEAAARFLASKLKKSKSFGNPIESTNTQVKERGKLPL